jgi:DNA transformation protein and related proteins
MEDMTKLPNIGKVLAKQLEMVGVTTISQLKLIGAEETFARLTILDNSACVNELYALEGAIQGIRWHELSAERKKELLEYFHFCINNRK